MTEIRSKQEHRAEAERLLDFIEGSHSHSADLERQCLGTEALTHAVLALGTSEVAQPLEPVAA